MNYLLDVNILIAWGWSDHLDHGRTIHWIARQKKNSQVRLLTSTIPEMGFVRVSAQRSAGQISVAEAGAALGGMLKSLGKSHDFLPDDLGGVFWPDWCRSPGRTTDAHLLQLAVNHDAILATLDAAIPNAELLPFI
ncbi:MAG TPA: hypothetical protein VIS74_08240 [Chthoniobacterales bacterium]